MSLKIASNMPRKLTIVSVVTISVCLFIFFKHFFSSTIIIHTQAPNYGEIKVEVLDGENIVEKRKILINPKYHIYFQKIVQIPNDGQIRFYFDTRHPIFITKGLLFVGKNFKLDWFGSNELSDDQSHNAVHKYRKTRFTALFEGFGESAFFKIDLKKDFSKPLSAELLLFIIISIISAIFIFVLGLLINRALVKFRFLNQHKLKILVTALLIIVFWASNPLKSLMAICVVFWTSYYLLRYKTEDIQKPESLIAGVFLVIIITGFATQAELLKILKNEVQTSEEAIEFDFFQNLGNRFATYFNFKKEIGHLNSQLKVDVFKRSPTTKVIVGKQGTMFEGTGERRVEGDNIDFFDNISDYLGRLPFEQGELNQWSTVINQRNCWLKQKGIDYLFTIAPTKALVYPELLPDVISDLKANENETRIKLLDERLKQNENLAYLNLTQPLLEAKTRHKNLKLFYRTDFHWNYLGAYYAYQAIIDKLAASTDLGISSIPLNQFNLEVNPNWAHARFLGLLGLLPKWYNNEQYITLMPKMGNPIKEMEPYGSQGVYDIQIPAQMITSDSGVEYRLEYILNKSGEPRKILVIGDSFIQKVFPLISAHGNESYFSRAVFGFPDEIVDAIKPDIVIQEILNMFLLRSPPINPPVVQRSQCP